MSPNPRRLQFGHFLLHAVQEARFRLSGLLQLCQDSRRRFEANDPDASGSARILNYHFAGFCSLVQTIKDVLPVVAARVVAWNGLSEIRHIEFMRAVRNAITHDGNPVINAWVDGRYYVACDFVRLGQGEKAIVVRAPHEDIETLVKKFMADLCVYLRGVVTPLISEPTLQGPAYGSEFFDAAFKHPSVPTFARQLYAAADHSALEREGGNPMREVVEELDSIVNSCRS